MGYMKYFMDIDTSFLLQIDEGGTKIIGPREVALILLPIVLDEIFTDLLLVYAGIMFGLYVIISIFVRVKGNKLINAASNNDGEQKI